MPVGRHPPAPRSVPTVCPRCRWRFPPRESWTGVSVGQCAIDSSATPTLRSVWRCSTVSEQPASERPARDQPWMMRTYSGHSTAAASNELYRTNLAKGQTGLSIAFDLPTQTGYDPDSPDGARRGRQGRRAGRPPRPHAHAARRHPARPDEHVDDDQRHGGVAARAVRRQRRGAGRRRRPTARHDAERHRQGVPVARHVHLPARAVAPADRRHGRLVRRARPDVEPDERVLVPPAGGRGDAGAGDRLRAGDGDRRARRGARLRPGRPTSSSRRCSGRSRSSSTPASGSSRRSASCGRSPRCGTASASSATA